MLDGDVSCSPAYDFIQFNVKVISISYFLCTSCRKSRVIVTSPTLPPKKKKRKKRESQTSEVKVKQKSISKNFDYLANCNPLQFLYVSSFCTNIPKFPQGIRGPSNSKLCSSEACIRKSQRKPAVKSYPTNHW